MSGSLNSARSILLSRSGHRTVAQVMSSRDERAKDAITQLAATNKKVWEYRDWIDQLRALESCQMSLDDWVLTV